MTPRSQRMPVKIGFEEASMRIPIAAIVPLRDIPAIARKSKKYAQIAASIAEVGIIEPPVVARDAVDKDRFHLLDGHLRVDIVRATGCTEIVCLIATDDEAFTYNRRVCRMATIQEHLMILNAVKKGVSEERLARALNVNISSIRTKRTLLVGICSEVVALLRDRHVPINTFRQLRALKPLRQIEAAQLMIAMNRFSQPYARSLVAATPDSQLADGYRPPAPGLTTEQIALMQRESEKLERDFRSIETSYGADHLDLVLAMGYVGRLLGNARVVRHLAQHHAGILAEFQKVADLQKAA